MGFFHFFCGHGALSPCSAPSVKRHRRSTVYRLGKEKRRELRQERHVLRR